MSREDAPRTELAFSAGWAEILGAPDCFDYQNWIHELTRMTAAELSISGESAMRRWQLAIERAAYLSIPEDDLREMSEAEIVETALLTVQTNLESIGWEDPGLSFVVPDLAGIDEESGTAEPGLIDLRTFNVADL